MSDWEGTALRKRNVDATLRPGEAPPPFVARALPLTGRAEPSSYDVCPYLAGRPLHQVLPRPVAAGRGALAGFSGFRLAPRHHGSARIMSAVAVPSPDAQRR